MSLTVGVILAAGASERMGQPKQLLKLDGKPLLLHVVDAALASQLDGVVVVVAPDACEVRTVIADRPVAVVENPRPERGNWSSLVSAIDTIESDDSIVVLLADMPEVATDVIDGVIAEASRKRAVAAVSVYDDGVASHPILLSPVAIQAAAQRQIPRRLWSILVDDPPHQVLHVEFDRAPPIDVDTPEAYVELLRKRGAAPEGSH